MEIFRLISMTDFVQQQAQKMYEAARTQTGGTTGYVYNFISVVPNYANLLKHENNVALFIPVDNDGNVILKPESNEGEEYNDYLKAKEKCFFLVDNYEESDDVIFINDKKYMISKETGHLHFGSKSYKTIEDISNDPNIHFDLSTTALIFLKNNIGA